MDSKRRRIRRRFFKKLLFDHKNGVRGIYLYTYHGPKDEYEVQIWDDWISIQISNGMDSKPRGLVRNIYLDYPNEISSLSFMEPIENPWITEYPAYRIIGTDYFLSPHGSGNGVTWKQLTLSHVRVDISFEEIFDDLTDKQKEEAIWNLGVLRGKN